VAIINTIVQA